MIKVITNAGDSPSIPGRIDAAKIAMLHEVGDGIATTIGAYSGSTRIAAATRAVPLDGAAVRIAVGERVPFAMIRNFGGEIVRKKKRGRPSKTKKPPRRALKFADGTFRPRAHQTGIHYAEKGIAPFHSIVGDTFRVRFGKLR